MLAVVGFCHGVVIQLGWFRHASTECWLQRSGSGLHTHRVVVYRFGRRHPGAVIPRAAVSSMLHLTPIVHPPPRYAATLNGSTERRSCGLTPTTTAVPIDGLGLSTNRICGSPTMSPTESTATLC
jgi:hypothetical protein